MNTGFWLSVFLVDLDRLRSSLH